jgi:hypothetical protein
MQIRDWTSAHLANTDSGCQRHPCSYAFQTLGSPIRPLAELVILKTRNWPLPTKAMYLGSIKAEHGTACQHQASINAVQRAITILFY